MQAINLKTEHMYHPLGIDITKPYLSWICNGGITQTAYEISAMTDDMEVWNSGIVKTNAMNTIYGGSLISRQQVVWKVRLWDENNKAGEWSEPAYFEMGLLDRRDFAAKWINPEIDAETKEKPEEHKPAAYLKKEFMIEDTIFSNSVKSRLYITCHGVYAAYLNGKRVGNFVLAPATGTYDKKLAYQTYDVTELMKTGKNELLVALGNGWYRSCTGVDGDRNLFGADISLYCQLEVDGNKICISDESWLATSEGPIRENDMQQGEVYDAGREKILDKTSQTEEASIWHEVKLMDFGIDNLVCSNTVPVSEHESFDGRMITTPNGETVIDFGQNLAGYVEFTVHAHAGDKITLWHGEALDENGNFTNSNFQPGDRHKEGGVQQKITYICKEGLNHYKPSFTIMGYQYVRVETGIPLEGAIFTSHAVYSKMDMTGSFTSSNEYLNQLFHNSVWSQKSNFCDIPTDCPTRERAGWTGDAGVFVDTGLYLMEAYPVFRKWLGECRLSQYEDGRVRNIAPPNSKDGRMTGILAGSVGWGDASIIVPYTMYKRYGDIRILEENYSTMKRWYEYLENRAKENTAEPGKAGMGNIDMSGIDLSSIDLSSIDLGGFDLSSIDLSKIDLSKIDMSKMNMASMPNKTPEKENPYKNYTIDSGFDYGEWCEPGKEVSNTQFTQQSVATAYLSYSGKLMSEIAEILGEKQASEHYAEVSRMAKKGFRYEYTENGRIVSERQCEYVRALEFELLDGEEAEQAARDLNDLVIKNNYHLNTGFLSTPFLCGVLVKYGYLDTAYRLLLQDTSPSWLYAVKKAANTIWETWDGIKEDGTVSASLNHYSYGVISGWLIKGICGIKLEHGRLSIVPNPYPLLQHARAEYASPLGKIMSGWKYEGDKIVYEFEIPANVNADIILPDGRRDELKAGYYTME